MWKSIKPILAQIFTSKKALYTMASILVWVLAKAGVGLEPEAVLPIMGALAALVLGTGMQDFGKEAKRVEGETIGKLAEAKAPDPS